MLRDEVGGSATNLLPAVKPNDIYQRVADVVQRKLTDLKTDQLSERDRQLAKLWLAHGINRKLVKRSVMTLPYGSTRYSCAEFIVADYLMKGEATEFDKSQYNVAANFLSHLVWNAIGEVVVAATSAMAWLQKCASALIKSGQPQIRWTTPSGFPVVQVYTKPEFERVNSLLLGGVRIKVAINGDEPHINRHKNGISPNFVHSMDASHLTMTVHECAKAGIDSLAMIHDDYGTHAADAQRLFEIVRETFVRMYEENDPLNWFRDHYDGLPTVPKAGSLDIGETQPTEEPMREQVLIRLDPEQYRTLERQVPPPVVTAQTTELQAGYQLGVQTVLKLLREGYIQSITTAGYRTLNAVKGRGKHWTAMIDLVHVEDLILNERVHSFVVAGYLVVFGIGVPWYSPEHKVFEERLVLAISEHPGSFRRVVKAMETVAVANGCTGVAPPAASLSAARLQYRGAITIQGGVMGDIVSPIGDIAGAVFKPIGKALGIDPGGQAAAIKEHADRQAQATLEHANRQAEATKRASSAQVAQINAQAQASAQAQQATTNQANLSAQLQAQANQPQPQTQVDLTSQSSDSIDPRRKYRGAASSVGGTHGGVGIRLT
ncbi:hypothetical protein DFQ30_010697 [Apophysomyces sp. BC1015]|nr:hypothetical protein DFQ30_010697 [Apophysomyces sp. BC1015]